MSLNVTSAPQTLALLQALSRPIPSPQTTSPSQTSIIGQVEAPTHAVVPGGAAGTGTSVQHMFTAADGVAQALTAADAADAAGQAVVGLMQQMHTYAGQAADPSTSDSDRAGLDQQFQASAGQIGATLSTATVNGANLVDGSMGSGLKVTLADQSTASLTPVDLTPGGATLGLPAQASIATPQAAASARASLATAIGAASAGLSTLQAQADQISAHTGFIQTQASASPRSADPDGDSARLMALQVSQQLSAQSTAIANQSPQAILSLFRS